MMARVFFFLILAVLLVLFLGNVHGTSDLSPTACHCRPVINVDVDANPCDVCKATQKLQQEVNGLKEELKTIKHGVSQIQSGE